MFENTLALRKLQLRQMGDSANSASSRNSAQRRQGEANAAAAAVHWNDVRRVTMLLDAYIQAPNRLCQMPELAGTQQAWDPAINDLSKLIYGQKISVERETARFLNATPAYMTLARNQSITPQVVKIQITKVCQEAAGVEVQAGDTESVTYKAQFITRAHNISEQAMQNRRESQRPARNDPIIARVIAAPIPGQLGPDGSAPALAIPNVQAANPAVVQVDQLIGPAVAQVVSRTSHSQSRRRQIVSVAAGAQPPSIRSRTTDSLLSDFSRMQENEAVYRQHNHTMLAKTFIYFKITHRGKKAEAAFMTAKGQLLSQHIQAFSFLSNLPESPFRTQAISQQRSEILELGRAHREPITRESSSIFLQAHMTFEPGHVQQNIPQNIPQPLSIPQNIQQEVVVEPESTCYICQALIRESDPVMTTPCSHTFHFQCLRPWMVDHSTCPNCRSDFNVQRPPTPDSSSESDEDLAL
jgi:hypothetical protein